MARDDVNIKVSADVAEAIRMWRAMQEGPEAMAHALDKTGASGRRAATGMQAEFGKMVGQWASIGGAIAAAKAIIDQLIRSQQEYNKLLKDSNVPTDTMARQFMVQGGLTNAQGENAKHWIVQAAKQRSVEPKTAFAAATQMVSSGFTPEQVESGGLDEFLKLLNATNATGKDVDSAGLAKAMALFLDSTKQGKTVGTMAGLSREVQGLFKSTNIQTGDLSLFAKEAGKIDDAFPDLKNKQLSLLSQFEGVTDVAGAGTALRAALSAIRTARGNKTKLAALKSIGVDFSQVDNESFLQVQDTLTRAFAGTDQVTGNIAAQQLFGDEGKLAKGVLFTPKGQALTRERMAMAANESAYQRDVAITEGSLEARARAAEAAKAEAFVKPGYTDPETVRGLMISEMKKRGFSPFNQSVTGAWFDTMNVLPGMDAERALRATFTGGGESGIVESVLGQARSTMPRDSQQNPPVQRFEFKHTFVDQDGIAIPHKSDASKLNRAK